MEMIWDFIRLQVPLSNHLLFPSIVALTSFHLHCWVFTLYDYFVLKRDGIKQMLYECALPQTVIHLILNTASFIYIDKRIELPEDAPTLVEFLLGLIGCFIVGDFLIYWEHVFMHRIAFLRHNIHSTHHRFTSPLYSFNAGWVHPIEIAVAMVCELSFPYVIGIHPFTLFTFLWLWVFLLVEEHSGDPVWWSLWNISPTIGGGAEPHNIHHAPLTTKNFGFVFSIWDRLFGTFHDPEAKKI